MQLEKNMAELDALVKKLEAPETTLEEGIELFEKSLGVTREAMEELKRAKNKINEIKAEMDGIIGGDGE